MHEISEKLCQKNTCWWQHRRQAMPSVQMLPIANWLLGILIIKHKKISAEFNIFKLTKLTYQDKNLVVKDSSF